MILRSRIIHSSYTATRYTRHAAAHARALRGRCVRAASLYGRLARAEVPARRPRATHSRPHSLLLPPRLVSRALENMRGRRNGRRRMRRVRASFIYNERTRPGRGGRRATAFAGRRAPRERGVKWAARLISHCKCAARKLLYDVRGCCAPRRRHLYSAPRGEARRGSRRSLPSPPRRRAGGGARVAPAPCALGAVYIV